MIYIIYVICFIIFICSIYFAYSNIQYNKYYKSLKKGTILRDVNKGINYKVEFKIEDAVVLIELGIDENTGEFFETPTSKRITMNIKEMFINKEAFTIYGQGF